MHWPQYTMLAMYIFALGHSIHTHGQTRSRENAMGTLLGVLVGLALLYAGGFFGGDCK